MATSISVALHFKRLFGCALSNVSGARASPTHVSRAPVSSVTAVVAAEYKNLTKLVISDKKMSIHCIFTSVANVRNDHKNER